MLLNRKEKRRQEKLVKNFQTTSVESVLQSAVQDHLAGQLRQAEKKYRQVLDIDPGHFDATHLLGVLAHQKGNTDKAIRLLRKAVAIRQDNDEAVYNLGLALSARGDMEDALQAFDHVLELNPGNAKAPFNAAVMLADHGHPEGAVDYYRKAIVIDSGYIKALINLGGLLETLDRFEDAEAVYRQAVDASPDNADARCQLGRLLQGRGRYEEARVIFRAAIDLQPEVALIQLYMGHLLHDMERLDEAVDAFRASLRLDPTLPGARVNLGDALREKGDLTGAEDAYRQSINLDPHNGEAYRCLAELKKFAAGDPEVTVMEKLLKETAKQGGAVMDLHYALAKAYLDMDDAGRSFAHLAKANAIKRSTFQYDVAHHERFFERLAGIFDDDRFKKMAAAGNDSLAPVFIVGMPRSGTTLVEQILASHPQVHAGGEMDALSRTIVGEVGDMDTEGVLETFVNQLKGPDLVKMGGTYLKQAGMTEAGKKTDKMPGNFMYVGLIRLILPNAKIIHCQRDPVDTCLSCLQRLFANGQRFSYDQIELGRYYVAYDRLMRHWHNVQGDHIHRLHYEGLIADQESETRRLLEYCGLPWDPNCLQFQKTERTVRTASASQVRQPLYQSSVRRSLPFRSELSDLLDTLGPLAE